MKKHISLLLFTILFSFSLFSYSGVYSGEKNIKIISTSYFDIIYPEKCSEVASLLFENADRIFNEVTEQYGIKPSFKIPICITSKVDVYNAFYTPAPFNRIVLYDTTSNTLDDLSSSFSESFLSTFRHELTHAVTYNMKNSFWDGFSNIFGDVAVPGYFFVTPGFAEGAAVASESQNGEGRLNNEYAKHFVKQAKIENSFPSFYNVQGASNTNIIGDYYYFNGAFHDYLQKKYGMEKYRELWESVTNLSRPGFSLAFHKVYKKGVRKEWKAFIDSYQVPENIITNVLDQKVSIDFFNNSSNEYSKENKSGSRFSSLFSNEKGVYYTVDYSLYKSTKELHFVSYEELNKESNKRKDKVIFRKQLCDSITPSIDGRFIAVSFMTTQECNIKSVVEIYDTETKKTYKVAEKGIKEGRIIKKDNDYYLVSKLYDSPKLCLIIKKIELNNDEIKSVKDVSRISFPINTYIASFTDIGRGKLSFIEKKEKNYSIVVLDVEKGKIEKEYVLPKNLEIREMSYKNGNLIFSYVKDYSMPRLAFLNLENEKLFLSNIDLSGGIFNPVLLDNKEVLYKASFYKEDRLLKINKDSVVLKEINEIETTFGKERTEENERIQSVVVLNKENEIITEETIHREFEKKTRLSLISKEYNPFKKLYKGIIAPISLYKTESFGPTLGKTSISDNLLYGITYATSNPWSSGTDDLLILTLGYNPQTNSFGIEGKLTMGTATSLISYNMDLKTEFDKYGWKQSGGTFFVGSGFNFGKLSSLNFQGGLKIIGGRTNKYDTSLPFYSLFEVWNKDLFEIANPGKIENEINVTTIFNSSYSNVHMTGSGKFERSGLRLTFTAGYAYDSYLGDAPLLSLSGSYHIPHLIPVIQKKGLTYNLPIILNLSLLPQNSDYGLTKASFMDAGQGVIDGNIHTVLFGWDVQNSVPYLEALYFQKAYLTFGYDFTIASYKGTKSGFQPQYFIEYLKNLEYGKSAYLDSIYLQASVELTPNIGVLSSSTNIVKITARLSYPLHTLPHLNKGVQFSFGLNTSF